MHEIPCKYFFMDNCPSVMDKYLMVFGINKSLMVHSMIENILQLLIGTSCSFRFSFKEVPWSYPRPVDASAPMLVNRTS